MISASRFRWIARRAAAAAGLVSGAYAAYVALTWLRYGQPRRGSEDEADPLLDRFMPDYDVVDRHHARVPAPAQVTLTAARELDLFDSPPVRAIFRARELVLGAARDDRPRPRGMLAETLALGWVVLAEDPEREVVVGAVTRPWEANVTFRSVPPDEFREFAEPDYVKIVWTLRADPISTYESVFRTETRAVATDHHARARFRRYWSLLSPGIIAIRGLMVPRLRAAANRRLAERVPDLRVEDWS